MAKTLANDKNVILDRLRKSFYTMLWLMVVTFPLAVMKHGKMMIFRWGGLIALSVGGFLLSYLWYYFMDKKNGGTRKDGVLFEASQKLRSLGAVPKVRNASLSLGMILVLVFPFIFSQYNTQIMINALIYMILGLGLNIIIGWGGLLNLGYAAFFAIGAYTYALLYKYLGIGFWIALPLGGIVAGVFGILVGFPVLRLRGDYLAIVTLAFSEIVRIVLNNWGEFTGGPDGIPQIPRPGFFGVEMDLRQAIVFTYFIALGAVGITVFIMRRVENSRWGRAWEAMREDEVAAESMGVDITKAKLNTFAMGSFFAGIAGVIMAAKTRQVTPDSFGLLESVMVLSIVVLGGMGSIPGVIIGALLLKLLPEYFRAFSQYRMLVFGLVLVIMMVFRPGGLVTKVRKIFKFDASGGLAAGSGNGGDINE